MSRPLVLLRTLSPGLYRLRVLNILSLIRRKPVSLLSLPTVCWLPYGEYTWRGLAGWLGGEWVDGWVELGVLPKCPVIEDFPAAEWTGGRPGCESHRGPAKLLTVP